MRQPELLSNFHGGPAPETPASLWDWVSSGGVKHPEVEALVVLHQQPDHLSNLIDENVVNRPSKPYLSWTFAQLFVAVEHTVSYLLRAGVRRGDVILLFVPNGAEWALILWASFRLGAIFVPADPTSLARPAELQYLVDCLDPAVVVVQDGNAAKAYDLISEGRSSSKLKLICNDDSPVSLWIPLSQLPPEKVSLPSTEIDRDSIAFIMFTSGTSSFPKGCPLSVCNIVAEIEGYHSFWASKWDATSRFLVTTSCFRPICYLGCLNSWQSGGCVIFPSSSSTKVNDEPTIAAIISQNVTHLMLVPYQLRSLAIGPSVLDSPQNRPTSLRFVTCSGDTCSASVIADAKRKLQAERLVLHWGMSEGAPLFGWRDNEPIPVSCSANIPSIGFALPGTRVRICEVGHAAVLPRDTIGELQVDSASLIDRYLSDQHTSDAFVVDDQGRWFRTGDLTYMNHSGAIFVVGRSKDQIMCKGFGIVPSIVEDCLETEFQVEVSPLILSSPVAFWSLLTHDRSKLWEYHTLLQDHRPWQWSKIFGSKISPITFKNSDDMSSGILDRSMRWEEFSSCQICRCRTGPRIPVIRLLKRL